MPFLSVIVPARNEELKIRRCLQSLLNQDYPNYEIIVIDDRSTDNTGQIIQEMARQDNRITFVEGKTLPDGWIGKCNALAHAVGYASGDWLLFTDADTCHGPHSLTDSLSYALTEGADMISFVPVQELGSFWERVIMPVLLGSFLVGDPFHTINDTNSTRAYAYGQFILIRRSTYQAVGGHQSIRDEIVEDHALGRVVKDKGFRILVADGKSLYSVRMYTDLQSLWHGWTKNLYSLIECRPVNLVLVLGLINACTLMPFIQLFVLTGMYWSGVDSVFLLRCATLLALEFMTLIAWYKKITQHFDGVSFRHFFLLPLGSLGVTLLYLHSAYLVINGSSVNWKGRHYTVNTSKTIKSGLTNTPSPEFKEMLIPKSSK